MLQLYIVKIFVKGKNCFKLMLPSKKENPEIIEIDQPQIPHMQ